MQGTKINRPLLKVQYALSLCVLVLALNFIGFYVIKDATFQRYFSDLFSPIINLLATLGLFMAAQQTRLISKRLGIAWTFFAYAQLAYTIGDILWALIELVFKQSPFPSISDLFYVAFYPIFMVGTFFLSAHKHSRIEWAKGLLDTSIILLSALLGFWVFLLGPLTSTLINQPLLTQVLTLAYPIGDLILISAVLWLLKSKSSKYIRLPILLLACGAIITIFADCIFSYESLIGTYRPGGTIDFLWMLAYIFIGMAGFFQAHTIKFASERQRLELPFSDTDSSKRNILIYLPWLWLVPVYLLLFPNFTSLRRDNTQVLYFGVGIILLLVIIRQIVSVEENRSLNYRLQSVVNRVQNQAYELRKTNNDLESEISYRKQIEEKLSYDALHDSLTNLPNRMLFISRLEQAIRESKINAERTYSLLFMDIDQFKVINDSLGHVLGDQLLITIAVRLKDCLRESDTAARLGGDEFVVLLENPSKEFLIANVVHRIQNEIQKEINLENHTVFITTSIGVVLDLAKYELTSDLLRDADIAMYRAKNLGKDRFEVFHEGMRTQAFTRMEIEEDLRNALEHNELELYFQPIVRLDRSTIIGFESLLRWNHPRYGLLQPHDFMTIAEESGLILIISQWGLLNACSQLREWQKSYPQYRNLQMHVNLSIKQLLQPEFVDQVKFALEESGLEGKYLKLEISENTLIQSTQSVAEKFLELTKFGVQFEIDDFGTGYSTFTYVQQFPIAVIKIDQSFVKDIGKKNKSIEIIRSIVSMACDLGMETIAEGIEDEFQLNELMLLGCDFGQGFYFSRPLSQSSVPPLLDGTIPLTSVTITSEHQE